MIHRPLQFNKSSRAPRALHHAGHWGHGDRSVSCWGDTHVKKRAPAGIILKETLAQVQDRNCHGSSVCDSKRTETNMDKLNLLHSYNEILYCRGNAWTRALQINLDMSLKHVEWKKHVAEGCVHYGTICIKFENMQNSILCCFWAHTYVAKVSKHAREW